ncbi:hypothetical protein J6590_040613 [Homalodisca vitripennis]|nr:hypothetical protein J6590_040613 [Homalodisca vitripennis]
MSGNPTSDSVKIANGWNKLNDVNFISIHDAFRREYKKLLKSGQEAPDEFESSWPFFDQMLFLRDVMEPRQLKGNIPPPVKDTETETLSIDAIEEDLELESEKDDSLIENSNSNSAVHLSEPQLAPTALQKMGPPLTTPTKGKLKRLDFDRNNSDRGSPGKSSSNKKKRSVDVSDAHFLEIEKAKLKLFETSASLKNDSEHQFLISLLPYLKNIPASRQLQVRNKLQQVLIDEQERNSFVAINYKDPLPSTVNQSPGHSSWSNSEYTGYSSDATSESSWDVPPVNSPLQNFVTNFK